MTDPAPMSPTAPASAPAPQAPKADRSDAWRPKAGARCGVVLMFGGARYAEVSGTIARDHKDGTFDVEYLARGVLATARMPLVERARHMETVGIVPPKS